MKFILTIIRNVKVDIQEAKEGRKKSRGGTKRNVAVWLTWFLEDDNSSQKIDLQQGFENPTNRPTTLTTI